MKIAILSLVPGNNYGGILQSYALKTVLERMGHDVRVLSLAYQIPPSFSVSHIPNYISRLFRRILKKSNIQVFAEYYNNKYGKYAFCIKYLNPRFLKAFQDIQPDEFEVYIVGSDQVWRPLYFEKQYNALIDNAFLSFTDSWNVRRIAYAASFGVDQWEYTPEKTQKCTKCLSRFDAVSVREESGIKLCKEHLNRNDAICLCDPTMLLHRNDYENIIEKTKSLKRSLLLYCLDETEELYNLVKKISSQRGLDIINANASPAVRRKNELSICPSVESWLRAFYDADIVITDSFHACVFSLIFHKDFIVFGNRKRGMSRFETLLKTFGQSNRLIFRADDYDENNSYSSFDNVDGILENLQKESIQFIKNALK